MTTPMSKEQIQEAISRSPFIEFMGLRVISAHPDQQEVSMSVAMRPEFERGRNTGQWHGGPIAAAIDTVGDYALVMALGRPLPTINFRVDYLKPALRTGLRINARVRRQGRSVGVVDVDVFDESANLVAIGRATYSTVAR